MHCINFLKSPNFSIPSHIWSQHGLDKGLWTCSILPKKLGPGTRHIKCFGRSPTCKENFGESMSILVTTQTKWSLHLQINSFICIKQHEDRSLLSFRVWMSYTPFTYPPKGKIQSPSCGDGTMKVSYRRPVFSDASCGPLCLREFELNAGRIKYHMGFGLWQKGLNGMSWYHGVSINSWKSCNLPEENVKQTLDTLRQAQSNKKSASQEIKCAISILIVSKKIPEFFLSSCSMKFF